MSLEDQATRHQVFLQRYAAGVSKRYSAQLLATYDRVIRRLEKSNGFADEGIARLTILKYDIEQLINNAYSLAKTELILEMNKLAEAEAVWSGQLLTQNSTAVSAVIPAATQIEAAYMVKTFEATPKSRVNLETTLNTFGRVGSNAIKQAVADGIIMGDTIDQVTDAIKTEQRIAGHRARTIARTATNHVSNVARTELFKANRDITDSYEWLATLDSRTTLTCAARDGEIYPISETSPKPPAHFNCRSTTIPVINPEFDLGGGPKIDRPARGLENKKQKVSGQTTFGGWLKKQPAAFQDEYFSKFKNGKIKAKLFKKGGLKIDKFTDAGGAEYSLDQLKALNPIEFAKADI